MIADKLVEGYQELYQRATEYSQLGEDLAKKKLATPKVIRKVKEIPPEENVAKVLGERPQSQVHTEVTHRIDLDPADWFWAKWRKLKPIKRPEPRPFDLEESLTLLAAGRIGYQGGQWQRGGPANIQPMSRREAQFWFAVRCELANPEVKFQDCANQFRKSGVKLDMSCQDIQAALKKAKIDPISFGSMTSLLPVNEVIEILLNKDLYEKTPYSGYVADYMIRFHYEQVPYLSQEELVPLRQRVARELDLNYQSVNPYVSLPVEFYLAAILGCQKELQTFTGAWPDNCKSAGYPSDYLCPQLLVLGLGDPKLVETEMRRLGLELSDYWGDLTRAWLAHTEFSALDLVARCVTNAHNKTTAENQFHVLALAKVPEAAPLMLEISLGSKVQKLARDWLQTEVGNAITGLIPVAAGQGKLADAALTYLRDKNRDGHSTLIAAAIKSVPADIAAKIKERVLDRVEKVFPEFTSMDAPEWLTRAAKVAAGQKPLAGSNFVPVDKLPPLVVQEKQLNREQVAAVLLALQHAQPAEPNDLLAGLKQHAEPQSLDTFVWTLFEQWLAEGGPPKHKWAMRALGFLGSDAVAFKLTPLIRAWPGESQHPRAVLGLECLRAIGTDTALMQLNGIAVKLKFKGLQNKAREFMEAIAAEKGLSSAQLEDRIVPDCDLDERGSREFDFGPRQFRFVLGPEMKPMLKDADGKVKTDLPKPGAKDDAAKANEAVNAWKLMKKQIKEVATIQAQRLEQAMVTGRRWPVADFETLLVKHPLMTNLVRLLLWGGYDNKGQIVATFRVTEDQTYADARDKECAIKGIDMVGIVHPLHLSEDQKSAWGEIFSDYEMVPPFPQLGRLIFSFDQSELKSNEITRFSKVKIPAATLIFGLEKLGWTRGSAMDNGQVNGHSKYFPSADLTAVVIMEEGFTVGYREGWTDQTISDIYFVPGQYQVTWGRGWGKQETVIPLKTLDPVIASEILKDLSELAAKGK
jgi:hypothetical protein